MAQDICEVASGFRSFLVAKTWDSAGLICASSFSISLSGQLCSPFQVVTSRCLDVRTVEESRQSNSRSSLIGGPDEPPASGQQIMQQEAQLRAAREARQQESPPGEASDTDIEFQRPAHRDQCMHNKRVASFFAAIQKNPSKAIELAEKGES